jgi:S-adenosylmethionine synthetase
MELILGPARQPPVESLELEVVERKGLGHPDTISDQLAEQFCRSLCRHYQERFGAILHHNVDKVLLWGGSAAPRFGGGRVLAPIEVFLAGRATGEVSGESVPIEELAVEGSRAWLRGNLHALDPERHVILHTLVRPGSVDLGALFRRPGAGGAVLANDSSIGVGYAPLSDLERIVIAVERRLNSPEIKAAYPATGEDVKVLGVRRGGQVALTVAVALVDRFVASTAEYLEQKERIVRLCLEAAGRVSPADVTVRVNAADDPASGTVYLTVTGTSAEAGDDGQAGRGNRANGLIAPYRLTSLESAAGKNPVSHVGKLYQIAAGQIARSLVEEVDGIAAAECCLVSQIGRAVSDPGWVDVRLRCGSHPPASFRPAVESLVRRELDGLASLWRRAVDSGLSVV